MSQHDRELERRARDLYLRASRDVDPATAGRLRAARRTALARSQPSMTRRLLLPAGAFAVVALASLMVWQPRVSPSDMPVATQPSAEAEPNDLPPDADSADPALYKDMQFYSWLAYNDAPSSSSRK
jgi:cell division septation protein DedD